MALRVLTDEEKRILDMLSEMYAQSMATLDSAKVVGNANAVLKVEGLIERLKRTGFVSPVQSTVERCVS